MHEITINLHMHTTYSDGTGSHADIAAAAIQSGLDAVIVTDHNVWVQGVEGYYGEGDEKVLLMVGEEVHDQARQPQKNHLLVFGAKRQMATLAEYPQFLIDGVNEAGGLAFIAHPNDPESPIFAPEDLSWVNWEVQNYTGIELWNALSEFKSLLTSRLRAIFYAFNFARVAHAPLPQTIAKWDELLAKGRPVVAVGGSDAHRMHASMGPIKRIIFPYERHFEAVNTHLLLPEPLSRDVPTDTKLILNALRAEHAFVSNDLPAPTKGFRFTAHCATGISIMGDTVSADEGATLQVKLPFPAESALLKDGEVIQSHMQRETFMHKVDSAGVYRVEAYLNFKGARRGWIYSNPIYVR